MARVVLLLRSAAMTWCSLKHRRSKRLVAKRHVLRLYWLLNCKQTTAAGSRRLVRPFLRAVAAVVKVPYRSSEGCVGSISLATCTEKSRGNVCVPHVLCLKDYFLAEICMPDNPRAAEGPRRRPQETSRIAAVS
ncbi:unnamed protein product [Scytosiphon promiscuus]